MLRKAQKKQALDTLVIQQGDFTTDFVRKLNWKDWMNQELSKVAQGKHVDEVLLDVEDEADVMAAKKAKQEMRLNQVEAEFVEAKGSSTVAVDKSDKSKEADGETDQVNGAVGEADQAEQVEIIREGEEEEEDPTGHVEDYMFKMMLAETGLSEILPLSDFLVWSVWFVVTKRVV